MRWLLFLSRLAFICGVCFLLAGSLEIKDWIQIKPINSTIFIIGAVFGTVLIPVVNICYFIILVIRRHLSFVPLWLSLSNLLFLVIQLVFLIYFNIHSNT